MAISVLEQGLQLYLIICQSCSKQQPPTLSGITVTPRSMLSGMLSILSRYLSDKSDIGVLISNMFGQSIVQINLKHCALCSSVWDV